MLAFVLVIAMTRGASVAVIGLIIAVWAVGASIGLVLGVRVVDKILKTYETRQPFRLSPVLRPERLPSYLIGRYRIVDP